MPTRTFVDLEGPLRDWLISTGIVGSRAYINSPSPPPASPWISFFLVTAVPDAGSHVPSEAQLVQFDCYGRIRKEVAAVAAALASAIESIPSGFEFDETVRCRGAVVSRRSWFPDPATGAPRYSVDGSFFVYAHD